MATVLCGRKNTPETETKTGAISETSLELLFCILLLFWRHIWVTETRVHFNCGSFVHSGPETWSAKYVSFVSSSINNKVLGGVNKLVYIDRESALPESAPFSPIKSLTPFSDIGNCLKDAIKSPELARDSH